MSELKIPIDRVHLTELMRNPVIVRIVSILDLASLSILELLEYNLERKEINYALSEGVIGIDKTTSPSSSTFQLNPPQTMREYDILLSGDSYFYDFLNSKVRLTELGLYILDSIKGDVLKKESSSPLYQANALEVSLSNPNIME
jgi:hypothetical protein